MLTTTVLNLQNKNIKHIDIYVAATLRVMY